jgi:hypothetical protein
LHGSRQPVLFIKWQVFQNVEDVLQTLSYHATLLPIAPQYSTSTPPLI